MRWGMGVSPEATVWLQALTSLAVAGEMSKMDSDAVADANAQVDGAVVAFEKELIRLAQEELDSWCDAKEGEAVALSNSHDEEDRSHGGLHRDWQSMENKRKLEMNTLWKSVKIEKVLVKGKLKENERKMNGK